MIDELPGSKFYNESIASEKLMQWSPKFLFFLEFNNILPSLSEAIDLLQSEFGIDEKNYANALVKT